MLILATRIMDKSLTQFLTNPFRVTTCKIIQTLLGTNLQPLGTDLKQL